MAGVDHTQSEAAPASSHSVADLLSGLNPAQRAAVTSPASVVQVLAPPGSGKTKTLTSRVAYLITHLGYQPRNIIVCTFTVKAAREMKERLGRYLGEELSKNLILGTFHSLSRRYLAAHASRIGLDEKFGIADSSDSMAIIKRIVKKLDLGIAPNVARSRISNLKAKNMTLEQYIASTKTPTQRQLHPPTEQSGDQEKHNNKRLEAQEFAMVYADYQEQLRVSNLLDFDDLLLRCVDLLGKFPSCVSKIDAVLVDEFQDTSIVQFELLQLFAQCNRRITTVGDPDQSIYGWRSAEVGNLERMQQRYPDTHVAKLEENYRSSGAILMAAHEVIQQDESRPEKPLTPTHSIGISPVLRILAGAAIEARWIVAEITRSIKLNAGLLRYSDYAILLRSASLSRLIEAELGKAGVSYKMVGGLKFFDRMEVKIVLDYLRVISHPEHDDALARIANVPTRGIGETIDKLLEEAGSKKTPLWSFILNVVRGQTKPQTKVSSQALKGLASFTNTIIKAQNRLKNPTESEESLTDYMEYVIKNIGLYGHLVKTKPEEVEVRWANIEELVAQASDIVVENEDSDAIVADVSEDLQAKEAVHVGLLEVAMSQFLANVALASETQREGDESVEERNGQVTISTMHAAKGLEWPVVFIPSAYEGSIPHSRAEDTDEERRLLYVAMTRAQCALYLSIPQQNSQSRETELSQFLVPNGIASLVSPQGPKFSFETIKEIAAILRRPCPSPKDIDRARESLKYIYDNYNPVITITTNGYETQDYTSCTIDDVDYSASSVKRRRVENHTGADSLWSKSGQKLILPGFKSVTTMQGPDGYSIANTTMNAQFTRASTLNVENPRNPSPTKLSHCLAGSGEGTNSYKPARSKIAVGQTSLSSFFSRPVPNENEGHGGKSSRKPPGSAQSPLEDISRRLNNADCESKDTSAPRRSNFQAATSLHTNPEGQMSLGPQRKTLGMKRSLHGWTSRTFQGPGK